LLYYRHILHGCKYKDKYKRVIEHQVIEKLQDKFDVEVTTFFEIVFIRLHLPTYYPIIAQQRDPKTGHINIEKSTLVIFARPWLYLRASLIA
jgi:hypothetical protein